MNDRMKEYYKKRINELRNYKNKCRVDDYEGRARYRLEIEELENKINGVPDITERSTEDLQQEKKQLEAEWSKIYKNKLWMNLEKLDYVSMKKSKIIDELSRRSKEEKKNQELKSDIFSTSDFVSEETPTPAEEVLNENIVKELSEYAAQAIKELYRYGMDFGLVKQVYGSRVIPVLSVTALKEESYTTFDYYSNGSSVYRIFKGGINYTEDEFNSISNIDDYRKLLNDTGYHKYLLRLKMSVEELAEMFIRYSIRSNYKDYKTNTPTANFRHDLSEIYYTRQAGATAVDEMKEIIKQYLLGNVKLSDN